MARKGGDAKETVKTNYGRIKNWKKNDDETDSKDELGIALDQPRALKRRWTWDGSVNDVTNVEMPQRRRSPSFLQNQYDENIDDCKIFIIEIEKYIEIKQKEKTKFFVKFYLFRELVFSARV